MFKGMPVDAVIQMLAMVYTQEGMSMSTHLIMEKHVKWSVKDAEDSDKKALGQFFLDLSFDEDFVYMESSIAGEKYGVTNSAYFKERQIAEDFDKTMGRANTALLKAEEVLKG